MDLDLYDRAFAESKKSEKLLYFEMYSNDMSFCGYVLSYNAHAVQIQHYTRYGKKDGVIILQYSDISHIVETNEYLQSMQLIVDNSSAIYEEKEATLPLQPTDNWVEETLTEYRNDESVILGVKINDNWVLGFANDSDGQFFSFTELDKNGIVAEKSIYKLNDVSSIHVNELEGRKRLVLYKLRKK